MQLEIINFEKFNPRTDRKRHAWFRLDNDFINDEKLFKLSPLEKFVWIGLLAFRSKKMEQIFDLDLEYLADQLEVKKNIISSAIQKLSDSKALKIHETVTIGNHLVSTGSPTNERTDERTNGRRPATADDISEELKAQWIKTYKDEKWIDFEISAAKSWILSNPTKAPKSDFKRFYNSWLKRGWENHRKTLQAKPLHPKPPSGMPLELKAPDPRNGPLKPEFKKALDMALKRKPIDEGPGAA